jgi:hypothetical protein
MIGYMTKKRMAALTAVSVLILAVHSWAQSGGGYDLTWSTIDGGGQTFSMGGGYELGGTVGQADAGAPLIDASSGYELFGGFWAGAATSCACRLYGDLVEPYCDFQPDVDDLVCAVVGFANVDGCPNADIFPCAPDLCATDLDCQASVTGAACINGGCRCTNDADCLAAGAVCNPARQGGRCELVDVDDLTALVAAYGGDFACPHPCPP